MKKNDYIDNDLFRKEICIYREKYYQSLEKGTLKPQLSNYLAECFIKIATNFSYKHYFIGYSYREDMVGDAIEICVRFAHKYNPELSNNPFSYFTQAVYNSFIQRIKKEKNQQNIKYKIIEDIDVSLMDCEDNEELKQFIMENVRKTMDTGKSEKVQKKPLKETKPKKESVTIFD